MEFIKGNVSTDAQLGITTVQPDRASKKCRIRNLRIAYFLTRVAVVPIIPDSCVNCESVLVCTENFAEQIVQKYVEKHVDSGAY